MNGVVYVFGELSSGYTQYPDDSVSDIFKSFYEKAKAATQLTIHREGNLMYYGYIRRLPNHRYIGLCVVLNGEIIKTVKPLFSIFEKAIADLIEKGDIIYLAPNGDIATAIEKLQYSTPFDVLFISASAVILPFKITLFIFIILRLSRYS
jgi:hypothetical protein